MDKIAKALIRQLMAGPEDMQDSFSIKKVNETTYKITCHDPIMLDEDCDGDEVTYVVELKVTKED